MKVLVTGAAGFIGSHVVDALRAVSADVVGVDSLDPGVWHQPPSYLRSDVHYVFRDLRHWVPGSEIDGVEAVVHLAALGGVGRAAKEPGNLLDANVGGTARLLDIIRATPSIRRVCLASSFSVYGRNYVFQLPSTGRRLSADRRIADLEAGNFEVHDEQTGEVAEIVPITTAAAPDPLEWYGASKYMQELCFRGFDSAALTIFRFSSVYGPRLRLDDGEATIIAKLAGWIRAGITPQLFEDGQQIRDWVYVGDIAEAIVRTLTGQEGPTVLNVCSGVPTTLLDACTILNGVLGTNVVPRVVGGFRPGDMRHCLGDPSALAALLGRPPRAFRDAAALAFSV
jgi:dTDP-L-rhamnose 4-epimerase